MLAEVLIKTVKFKLLFFLLCADTLGEVLPREGSFRGECLNSLPAIQKDRLKI